MRLNESSIFRIGLVGLALSHWKQASVLIWAGLMPLHVVAVMFVAALYLTSFAMLVAATARVDPKRFESWSYVSFGLLIASFAYRDAMLKAASPTLPTTDGHLYMDIAGRMLLHGQNPYAQSLAEAFRVYRMPLSYATPLIDGDFTDRVAYPALSFLVLVPLLLLRIPTYLAYAACFVAAALWIVKRAPWWVRPLVVAFFAADSILLNFAFGGVTDTVWMLCLVGAVFLWKRPTVAAVLVGLACAQKQHAWFLVPYLFVRVCHESGQKPWQDAPRRFLLTCGAVFVALNLPFFAWGPHAWLDGVFEPLVAPMIQLSEGLTAFSMTGYAVMPRRGLTIVFWSIYFFSLGAYARHVRVLKDLCWVLPGVVLWFGFRALMSYWYFYALTGVAALLVRASGGEADGEADDEDDVRSARSWRPTAMVGAALLAGVAAFVGWSALRPPPFAASLVGPLEAWETRVMRIRIHVESHLPVRAQPRFAIQSSSLQPLAWDVEFGPRFLEPGQSADYIIHAPRGYNEFEVADGARIAVSDKGDPSARTFVTVAPDRPFRHVDAVPNGDFTFVETRNFLPLGWSLEKSDDGVSVRTARDLGARERLDVVFGPPPAVAAPPPALAACVVGQRLDSVRSTARFADLVTTLALPEAPISLDVHVPEDANRPGFETVYGVRVAVMQWVGFILFGDDVPEGKLPTGEPFTSIAVKRGEWSEVKLALRPILERLHAPLHERRFVYLRVRDTDVPSVPIELGLFASVPAGRTATVGFGAMRNTELRPIDALVARRDASKPGLEVWRASFDMEQGNYAKAAALLEDAVKTEPTAERFRLLGDAFYLDEKAALAKDAFARSLQMEDTPEGNKGMGWSFIVVGDPKAAIPYLEKARVQYEEREKLPPRFGVLDVVRGLAVASAKLHDCDAAHRYAAEVVAENPASPRPLLEGCDAPK